jgi:hypothetical protein
MSKRYVAGLPDNSLLWSCHRMKPRTRISLDLPGMVGITEILQLSGSHVTDPDVDAWLSGAGELRALARPWFERMRQCGAEVRVLVHDGCPVACVEDAPFGYVNTFTRHANVGFFYGAWLDDPAGLLEGTGKRMRHVKLRPDRPVDPVALGNLIEAAYRDIKSRLCT